MKAVKIILLILTIIFVVIQFVPSGMPENIPEDEKGITYSGMVREPVLTQLRTSCFDCHSNQTSFPWYSKLAPSSWLLASHVRNGRSQLNFSEWETYSRREKIGRLVDIVDEVKSGEMPLKSYLLIHREAKLGKEEISALSEWAEETATKILE
jgi:hypothetical protein